LKKKLGGFNVNFLPSFRIPYQEKVIKIRREAPGGQFFMSSFFFQPNSLSLGVYKGKESEDNPLI